MITDDDELGLAEKYGAVTPRPDRIGHREVPDSDGSTEDSERTMSDDTRATHHRACTDGRDVDRIVRAVQAAREGEAPQPGSREVAEPLVVAHDECQGTNEVEIVVLEGDSDADAVDRG
ncbi:hypothetical protein [Curtobacterium sp. RRHDQ10]|uniref:hypothetical protein n=1 Tax=Curtobacterium phyllosphaerae TaxID=3413379 RepID=UPI003BF3CA0A